MIFLENTRDSKPYSWSQELDSFKFEVFYKKKSSSFQCLCVHWLFFNGLLATFFKVRLNKYNNLHNLELILLKFFEISLQMISVCIVKLTKFEILDDT